MKCLVTGGSGFIGSHIVDQLHEAGHEARIFDMNHSTYAPDCDHFIGSILDLEALRLAMNGVQAVFHLAAIADVDEVMRDPVYAESVNTRGTLNVLEAARRTDTNRVLYASTSWIYSDTDDERVNEETPIPPPRHLYTATKMASENYCRAYSELYELDYTIFRYGIPYGPRSRERTVVAAFVKNALEGKPITITGDGSQYRQFVYVGDLARGNVLGLNPIASRKTYNIDGGQKITIKEIAETVRDIVGKVEIHYKAARTGDFKGKMIDSSLARQELGWSQEFGFREGVEKYVEWFRENLSCQ